MNLALLAEHNLAEFGEYDRLIFEGESWTNRQLHDASCKLAGGLRGLGIGPDDKVVVVLPNGPQVLVSFPAIWRTGAISIPVLFLLETHEIAYILKNSRAKVVITSPDLHWKVEEARQGSDALEHIVVTGDPSATPEGCHSFERLIAESEAMTIAVERDKADVANILYTSGTTGSPKGVMQTHHNLYSNAVNGQNTGRRQEPGAMSLLVLPLAHSFGLGVLVGGYLSGAKSVLMTWFDPEKVLQLIDEYKVRFMAGVPTMFVYMLHHPDADKYDTSSVESWLVGAAPMPTEQLKAFEEKFGGVMYVGYGLTESSPGIATEREGMERKPGSTGIPMEGVEVKIVDDEGNELPRGEIGELCAKGDNISPGYFEMPDQTAETFRDGWLHTGDMALRDEDGYVFIVERKKDLIIRGGFNVYPKDVEEIIHQLPGVQECAVVGIQDEMMGEEVMAYIVPAAGAELTAEQVIGHCQAHLAKYKSPKFVEFISDMPKTTIGKIQKKELRKLAEDARASASS